MPMRNQIESSYVFPLESVPAITINETISWCFEEDAAILEFTSGHPH